jgi:methylenetetrahydrofolate dehydrogenase (NADP+)/methenyltetrahydrofolate cyclohydrolase
MRRIDGKQIRDTIKLALIEEVKAFSVRPELVIFYVGENSVIDIFIKYKEKFGSAIGVHTTVIKLSEATTTDMLIEAIQIHAHVTGIIVQLPLPEHIDTSKVLENVPVEQDVDVLSPHGLENLRKGVQSYLPPVVGAVAEIFNQEHVDLVDKKIVIIGKGKLVGLPISYWLESKGLSPTILTRDSLDFNDTIRNADIIISGAGSPSLIKPDMIKQGVILLDAGTSEEGGIIQGDIDEACSSSASIFTPVPGGIGPITIAILFRNLLLAATYDRGN